MYIVDAAVIRLFVGFIASCSKVQGNIEEINHFFLFASIVMFRPLSLNIWHISFFIFSTALGRLLVTARPSSL